MLASKYGHAEAVQVLIEQGALIEAADEVRIPSHATTHARSQTLLPMRARMRCLRRP